MIDLKQKSKPPAHVIPKPESDRQMKVKTSRISKAEYRRADQKKARILSLSVLIGAVAALAALIIKV